MNNLNKKVTFLVFGFLFFNLLFSSLQIFQPVFQHLSLSDKGNSFAINVNFKVYCRPHSEYLSSLAPNSSNYRETIRAFPNHTAGFLTRLMAL